MSDLKKPPEQIALNKLEDALYAYTKALEKPFTGSHHKQGYDLIEELERVKLNFRNQLLAIENELTTSLLNNELNDPEINRLKKGNFPKEG